MKKTISILNELSRIDLKKHPKDQIEKHLKDLGAKTHIDHTIGPGNSIFRVRPNKNDTERFETRAELSYRPEEYNHDYQRASTPNETMFYGSILPEKLAPTDLDIGRATACFEAAHTFRNNWFSSIEKITFSRWEVIENINLVVIAYSQPYLRDGSILNALNKDFRMKIKSFDPNELKKVMNINEFLGQEFSKKTIRADFDYMISAIYTDLMVKQNFDGVFYPSVKADGRGYNVCLTKECADNKLRLIAAGEGKIIKCGYKTEIINLAQAIISDDTAAFKYEEIPQNESANDIWKKLMEH